MAFEFMFSLDYVASHGIYYTQGRDDWVYRLVL